MYQPKIYKLKIKCPRCGGNLLVEYEDNKRVYKCLLCSRVFDDESLRKEVVSEWLKTGMD